MQNKKSQMNLYGRSVRWRLIRRGPYFEEVLWLKQRYLVPKYLSSLHVITERIVGIGEVKGRYGMYCPFFFSTC